ncbi:hypothetical protein NDU88_002954 [Pleurodeles waltl]|uniref:Uncharacterized protein n=1 Tax=Pleurodeles waltl TaxID=8319 RepID=A0AAV7W4M4_PLEWA|nr:hypothetical protein NDU88_002954 [Pleurodeles waltl]
MINSRPVNAYNFWSPGKGPRITPVQKKDGRGWSAIQSIEVDLATEKEVRASGDVPGGESSEWRESEQLWARFTATAKANGWEMAMAQMRAPTPHGSGQSMDKEDLQQGILRATGHIYSLPQGEQFETKKKVNGERGSGASKAKKTKTAQEETRAATVDSIDNKVGTSLL